MTAIRLSRHSSICSTMTDLFSDDEGPNDVPEVQLTINEHYAKAFEYKKEREELERRA